MDQAAKQEIMTDFLSWSGGTAPESEHEIYVYTDLSRPMEHDFDEVFNLLRDWMQEEEKADQSRIA